MPGFQKLTRETLPQHINDIAQENGADDWWNQFAQVMDLSIALDFKVRPVDIVKLFGDHIDYRTAKNWIRIYRGDAE